MNTQAKESTKIKRAREKLKKQFAEEEKQMTPMALQKMRQAIRTWISRHGEERINLKDKTFRLFDENKHPAKTKSNYVREMAEKIQQESAACEEEKVKHLLVGRVQKQPAE